MASQLFRKRFEVRLFQINTKTYELTLCHLNTKQNNENETRLVERVQKFRELEKVHKEGECFLNRTTAM